MLADLLAQKRKEILDRWLSLVLKTYSADAARFMQHETNRFANPVGQTFSREFGVFFDLLLDGRDGDDLSQALGNTVKIRAVQDFSASGAVAFVFLLKPAVRQALAERLDDRSLVEELSVFESRIDRLALSLFDRYMTEREKLYSIRLNESRRLMARRAEQRHAHLGMEPMEEVGNDGEIK